MRSGRRSGLRWLAAAAGLAVAGATAFAMVPAHADSATVNAQLSLSGVATKDSVLGGTTIGTVNLNASSTRTKQVIALPVFSQRSGTVKLTVTTSGKRVIIDGVGISRG